MSDATETTDAGAGAIGPVLFAYDGTDLAGLAIDQAANLLATDRDALVVCVWSPADVGFAPVNDRHFDAGDATQVHRAATETATRGASLVAAAGFRVQSVAVEAVPTWRGIVEAAEGHGASLIVMGSHRHPGLAGHLVGSVAAAVVAHAASPVLLVHPTP